MPAPGRPKKSSRASSMCTWRASRSTSSPARASSYSRFPSTLRAEYIGGVCSTSPTKDPSAIRTASSVSPSTGRVSSVRPAPSCVSVTWPKRTTASYSFSPSLTKLAILVASPMQMGSTPVAVGSSVPVCPQRRVLKSPFTRRTTSKLVGPLGLSTTTTPETSRAIQCFLDLVGDLRADSRLVAGDAAACGIVVPPAPELLRDGGHVDPAAAAEAHPPGPTVLRLAEAGRPLHPVHAARVVDEAVGEVGLAAGPGHHRVGDGDGGPPAAHPPRAR